MTSTPDRPNPATADPLGAAPAATADPRRTPRWIRSLLPSLIPSEARVAEALLANAPAIASSVSELAAQAQTSPATVVRACQSLGFSGFTELRDALQHEPRAASESPPATPDASQTLQRTIAAGMQQLESMATMLDPDVFALVVKALVGARRVLFATTSDLALLGQYATFRFATVGRAVEAPTDAVTMHLVAAGLAPGDVCVAVGGSGANALTVRIAQAAAAAGATLVAITSYARGPLADIADLHLIVGVPASPLGERDHSRIRVSQLLVIDALQAAIREHGDGDQLTEAMFAALANYTYRRSGH